MPTYSKDPKTGKFAASKPQNRPGQFIAPEPRAGRYDHLHPAERESARAASLYHEDNQVPRDRDGQEARFIERRQAAAELSQAADELDPDTIKARERYGATTPAKRVAPPTHGFRATDRAEA